MTQSFKYKVSVDYRAEKELLKFPVDIQDYFSILVDRLSGGILVDGKNFKKLKNYDLFEMRVRTNGQWRGLYGYLNKTEIIIVRFFRKKQQKTPSQEINLAIKRINYYK